MPVLPVDQSSDPGVDVRHKNVDASFQDYVKGRNMRKERTFAP